MSDDGNSPEDNSGRRNFLIGATCAVGSAGVVGLAVPFLGSWNPSAKALAAGAPIKIDIGKLKEGEIIGPIPAWRDKPIFVIKRTKAMLDVLNADNARLADPESSLKQQPEYAKNETRSIKPDILVLVGLCTHLGCSPQFRPVIAPTQFDAEWKGGFYCACHGSKFDLAGRVYNRVPAPSNLEVPPHYYESESILVIGEDEGIA
ncbi:MAG: ubiquinol-cytochrome c reductase iron-sulfur subunit [Pseudomonadales bacterium]|nr:ubiquinol-cytochrome c reductase iron-sulfur subunit [Pseudomonadales bacterium]